jgi:hypothetical protein
MTNKNSYILWRGKSQLDNRLDIVLIASGFDKASDNSKTGGLIQTYILVDGFEPHEAIKHGFDDAICGDCVHRGTEKRGRSCYVNVGQGPLSVYRAFKRGSYLELPNYDMFAGKQVRFGTYGDPAAVPVIIWESIALVAASINGYTHQWRTADTRFAQWCMASVEGPGEAAEAHAMGYRTFRVGLEGDFRNNKTEALCPASEEAGKLLQCSECMACGGNSSRNKKHIFIPAHGNSAVKSNARKIKMEIVS